MIDHINCWAFQVSRVSCHKFDDDRYFLFDKLSGRTHLINEFCMNALSILQQGCLSAESLLTALSEENGFFIDEEWVIYIDNMLTDLDEQGLIEPSTL
ncbi:MAG: HPr-rel-A system PqqD family peptide chaperone [Gammaproteobacteria bacterium]|nr:HPr-rel-A system PqqD family peptide chaperone [Gammaproteobacteria bacterium]HRX69938.1 HPr-rel-A system PqqD family peptide chaperone [Candidatus Competibacteraceae bacterium]